MLRPVVREELSSGDIFHRKISYRNYKPTILTKPIPESLETETQENVNPNEMIMNSQRNLPEGKKKSLNNSILYRCFSRTPKANSTSFLSPRSNDGPSTSVSTADLHKKNMSIAELSTKPSPISTNNSVFLTDRPLSAKDPSIKFWPSARAGASQTSRFRFIRKDLTHLHSNPETQRNTCDYKAFSSYRYSMSTNANFVSCAKYPYNFRGLDGARSSQVCTQDFDRSLGRGVTIRLNSYLAWKTEMRKKAKNRQKGLK